MKTYIFAVIAVLLMVACSAQSVNAEAYSAQDEFEAALAETITSTEHAERLAASARNVIDNVAPNTEVSLRSMQRALERNASEPTASFEAMATAYVVLSTISDEVRYSADTRIRVARVMASVERVAANSL